MQLRYDYSEEYNQLVENLMKEKPRAEVSEAERRHMELLGDLITLEKRQYRNVPIEGRLEYIQRVYFGLLNKIAKENGGCAELATADCGERCILSYKGELILLIGLKEYETGISIFSNAIREAESLSLSVEKERFILTMRYPLIRKEFAEDLSEEIERIRKEMISLRKQMRDKKQEILL